MTQYSIRPKRSAIHAQVDYFLHSMIPSVTCLRLSDASVICPVTYFQSPIQSAFLPYIDRSHQHCGVLLVIIAELRWPEVAKPKNFVSNLCVFKKTPYSKIFKIHASLIDVVVFKCHKIEHFHDSAKANFRLGE